MVKVSVALKTYNHQAFIEQAIDSVLQQVTRFAYEIVIGEDCSTDRTREIVSEIQAKYPDKIRLVLSAQNVGGRKNFIQTINSCKGDFIALLDGDDYWTSPDKLQKQVDFLEANPSATMCFHKVKWQEKGKKKSHHFGPQTVQVSYTLDDLLQNDNFIATSSVMFRKGQFADFPDWYSQSPFGDYPIFVLNAQRGLIGYLDENLGTYRRHADGMYSGQPLTVNLQRTISMYEIINAGLEYKYDTVIQERTCLLKGLLAKEYAKEYAKETKKFSIGKKIAVFFKRFWQQG